MTSIMNKKTLIGSCIQVNIDKFCPTVPQEEILHGESKLQWFDYSVCISLLSWR